LTDDSSNLVDMDNLDEFENAFFNRKPVATEQPEPEKDDEVDEEVAEIEDDALATEENDETEVEEEVEDPKPQPKKKASVQDRINELTAKAREAERREAELRRELEGLKVRQPEADTQPEVKQAEDDGPQPDDVDENGDPLYALGEFDPKFITALTRHTIQKEREAAKQEAEAEARQKQLEAEHAALEQTWGEKVSEAEKELPDLREHLQSLTDTFAEVDPAYGEFLAATVMSCDFGPQIMYYLSQNIGEAQKIVASGPAAATLALGRLDAKFSKPTQGREAQHQESI
jgi:vacuolar-type H+-ATPase subunit E/Vma4